MSESELPPKGEVDMSEFELADVESFPDAVLELIEYRVRGFMAELPSEAHAPGRVDFSGRTSELWYHTRDDKYGSPHDGWVGDREWHRIAFMCSCGKVFSTDAGLRHHHREAVEAVVEQRLEEQNAFGEENSVPIKDVSSIGGSLAGRRSIGEIILELASDDASTIRTTGNSYSEDNVYLESE